LAQTNLQLLSAINELMERCKSAVDDTNDPQNQWCNAAFAALE